MTVLSQHLVGEDASGAAPAGEVELQPLSGRAAASQAASTSYASATGRPSSYARVHGSASRAPARWRRIDTVSKEQLREVRYDKAEGEGIAKVGRASEGRRRRRQAGPVCLLAAQQALHIHHACVSAIARRSPLIDQRSATPSRPAQVQHEPGSSVAAAAALDAKCITPLPPASGPRLPCFFTSQLHRTPRRYSLQSRRCRGALRMRGRTQPWG